MPASLRTLFLLLPFILQPIVNFIKTNFLDLDFSLSRTFFYVIFSLAALFLAQLLLSLLFNKLNYKRNRDWIVLAVGLVYFVLFNTFMIDDFFKILLGNFYRAKYILIVLCLLIPILFSVAYHCHRRFLSFMLLFTITLIATDIFWLLLYAPSQNIAVKKIPTTAVTEMPSHLSTSKIHNVYFIIPDGHAGQAAYYLHTGENLDIIDNLITRGFHVHKNAYSNANQTLISLPIIYSMDYIISDNEAFDASKMHALSQVYKAGQNQVLKDFKARGYKYFRFADGIVSTCDGQEDLCIHNTGIFKNQDLIFISRTNFFYFLGHLNTYFSFINPYGYTLELPDFLDKLPNINQSPFFVSLHLALPHPPYRYTENCEKYLDPRSYIYNSHKVNEGDYAEVFPLYNDQLICSGKLITKLVDKILENDPDAIIIVQSDHGSLTLNQVNKLVAHYEDFDYIDSFNILSAYKVPSSCEQYLNDNFTAVNTFRFIFSCLDGKEPQLLKDNHSYIYFSHLDMQNITSWKISSNLSEIGDFVKVYIETHRPFSKPSEN